MSEIYPELHPTDLGQQAYDIIKDRILARQLKPGERISIGEVASALGISRTPVTTAVKRLAAEGLVAIVPRVGTFVTRLTVEDVDEIFEIRRLVESYALEKLFEQGKIRQLIQAINEPVQRMEHAIEDDEYSDYASFIAADRDLHLILVEMCQNKRLIDMYRELNVHVHITRAHYLKRIENAREAQQEHEAIIEALRRGAEREAQQRLSQHIDNVQSKILALVDELGGEL
jgi:DNA-binding GntR family transcriptional regulator